MARTLEQKIAEAQLNLARLKAKARSADTRQKILVGAAVIPHALQTPGTARWLVNILNAEILRDHDKAALSGLLEQLQSIGAQDKDQTTREAQQTDQDAQT